VSAEENADRPVLRIVRGAPTADELAALVAVVAAASSGGNARPKAATTAAGWAAHHRTLRGTLPAGGWRASSAPR
jgi:hypothetical protein